MRRKYTFTHSCKGWKQNIAIETKMRDIKRLKKNDECNVGFGVDVRIPTKKRSGLCLFRQGREETAMQKAEIERSEFLCDTIHRRSSILYKSMLNYIKE